MFIRTTYTLLFLFAAGYIYSQSSAYIHVDQFGYLANAPKVAVISDPQTGYNASDSFTPSGILEVRNASNDAVVFTAAPTIWDSGNTHAQSGDKGWWFDFSSVTTSGSYYIHDVGNNESSAVFDINNGVYVDILKAAGRAFFYNRCYQVKAAPYADTGWTDGVSFSQDATTKYIFDPSNTSLEKDLTGGWFDAGDYNKYITFAENAVHDLLWAYQESPNAFGDDWNIPESGNGLPDIIDEIKWELDWMLKMVNTDGSVILKMGSQNYSDNAAAPPSTNSDDRFYGPTCTSASIAIASLFAHASKVFNDLGETTYAQTLETQAILAWNYALSFLNNNTLETSCDNGEIVAGDADRSSAEQYEDALGAAIYLFDITGLAIYNQYVIDNINDATPMGSGNWDNYHNPIQDALLHYTTIPGNDGTTSGNIISSVTQAVTNNWNEYFGFTSTDLYRSFIPDWSYHWGSNKPKADFGILNNMLVKYGINPGSVVDYELKASEQIHYFHGVNPQGVVYLSNMYGYGAEHSVNEVYHTWFNDGTDWDNALTSLYGPAPGFVSGGPNHNYSADVSLQPPYNQPSQKSYLDWNTGFPQNSWEITEPAIYYQAAYLRLLASLNANIPLPVEWLGNPFAEQIGEDVRINWFTGAEWFNDKFEVEHSLDGKNYVSIGTVAGKGDSDVTQSYTFIHRQAPLGHNYYRIKQVDFNGNYQYSRVLSILIAKKTSLQLYPNPAKDQIILSGTPTDYLIQVFNNNNTIVYTDQFTGSNSSILVGHLPVGVYTVRVMDLRSQQVDVLRFVKND